jgi:hypothetical protein
MSQPKNRRRAARRKARLQRRGRFWCRIILTGETRNPIGRRVSLDTVIAIGFGTAGVSCDGKHVVSGERMTRSETRRFGNGHGWVTLRMIERHIRRKGLGRSVWTASINGPLWSVEYERKGPGRWVVTKAGEGFA